MVVLKANIKTLNLILATAGSKWSKIRTHVLHCLKDLPVEDCSSPVLKCHTHSLHKSDVINSGSLQLFIDVVTSAGNCRPPF